MTGVLILAACLVSAQPKDVFLPEGGGGRVEAWVEGLDIPWSLIFLPDNRALVSERPGTIRLIKNGALQKDPYAVVDVAAVGEGGLMGLSLHPLFPKEPYVYAMHTYRKGGHLYNGVIRLKDLGDKGVFDKVIFDGIPGGRFHDGGRIAFGPDGMLYITAGETFQASLAQDLKSLGGKILRVTPEGGIPRDNPFPRSPVWSYGNRNPQGLAWDPETGDLWESEHGPSGEYAWFAHDEVNIIVKGGNYGWPKTVCNSGDRKFIAPVVCWAERTTPPSGITFYRGDLWVATLRSEALIKIRLARDAGKYTVTAIERWFVEEKGGGRYGRLRDVVAGPDGNLYFLTNNRDGRGDPSPGDDKIYRIIFPQ